MNKTSFAIGAMFGFTMGVVMTAESASDGFLWGWTVMRGNVVICEEPWVWAKTKEIECERSRRW